MVTIVLILSALLHFVSPLIVTLDEVNGSDTFGCLKGLLNGPSCQSLMYVAKHTISAINLTIKINSSSLLLQQRVVFTDINGLQLKGQQNSTIICDSCSGITFYSCTQVQ